jgi:sodium/hydrogen antiporter
LDPAILDEFLELDGYDVGLMLVGVAALGAAVLPRLLSERPVSFPILYLAAGILAFSLPIGIGPWHPLEEKEVTERITELGVIIALMGVGLKIDRPFGWRAWSETWRLLAVTMPLTIAMAGLLGWWAVGLAPATAMLLGAVIAPTDPVLAADVQSGEPVVGEDAQEVDEGEVRFALTSEAGLNDGLAFPFTNAAIAMAVAGASPHHWFVEWFAVALVGKVVIGVVVGWAFGKALAFLVFDVTAGDSTLAKMSEGLVALAATLFSYGLTELAQGYGFIAVFVTALSIREYERTHEFHHELHHFAEQSERLIMAVILFLLGGAIVAGLFAPLTWEMILVAIALLFLVRPALGIIGLLGHTRTDRLERGTIAFFGIRGIGSLYYLAHGVESASFEQEAEIWALVGLVVTISIVVHGLAATPWMAHLEQREQAAR